MAETTQKRPSPVAASTEAKAILAKWTDKLGVAQIDLLDQFVKAADQYIQHHGGRMILPLRFTESFQIYALPAPRHLEVPRGRTVAGAVRSRSTA